MKVIMVIGWAVGLGWARMLAGALISSLCQMILISNNNLLLIGLVVNL